MRPDFHLGICQTPVLTSPEAVREALDAALADMFSPGIVLFPELFFGGFDYSRLEELADRTPEIQAMFREAAQEHGVALAATFLEAAPDFFFAPEGQGDQTSFRPLNSLYFFAPGQPEQRMYSKVHLFPAGEHLHFTPGPFGPGDFPPVRWKGLTIGGCVCYDLRFPEIFRMQTPHDPDLFLVAGQWPEARAAHWRKLLAARALENQCYVLACNGTGDSSLGVLGGGSGLVDPQGEAVFALGPEAGSAMAPYDPSAVEQARSLVSTRTSPFLCTGPVS